MEISQPRNLAVTCFLISDLDQAELHACFMTYLIKSVDSPRRDRLAFQNRINVTSHTSRDCDLRVAWLRKRHGLRSARVQLHMVTVPDRDRCPGFVNSRGRATPSQSLLLQLSDECISRLLIQISGGVRSDRFTCQCRDICKY